MSYRLHIDIPLPFDEEKACDISERVTELFAWVLKENNIMVEANDCDDGDKVLTEIEKFQYRLSNDEDRQMKNYLVKTEEGHATKNKIVVSL